MHKLHYTRNEYREDYLKSDEWQSRRGVILHRDKKCRVCLIRPSFDVHHLTYKNVGFEPPEDLIGVCRECHNLIHRHPELARESNIIKLAETIKRIRRPNRITEHLYERISNASVNQQRLISGVLKIPINEFHTLKNKRIHYITLVRILKYLQDYYLENYKDNKVKDKNPKPLQYNQKVIFDKKMYNEVLLQSDGFINIFCRRLGTDEDELNNLIGTPIPKEVIDLLYRNKKK